jgi:hypothetical protein
MKKFFQALWELDFHLPLTHSPSTPCELLYCINHQSALMQTALPDPISTSLLWAILQPAVHHDQCFQRPLFCTFLLGKHTASLSSPENQLFNFLFHSGFCSVLHSYISNQCQVTVSHTILKMHKLWPHFPGFPVSIRSIIIPHISQIGKFDSLFATCKE